MNWVERQQCPNVWLKYNVSKMAHCYGRADIYLTFKENNNTRLTLIHELVHARGYGSERNPHTIEFVRMEIVLLCRFMSMNPFELIEGATQRGLI